MDALTREGPVRVRRRLRAWSALLCVLVVVAIVWAIWFFPKSKAPANSAQQDANTPIPVLVTHAASQSVPVYQDGLGTVQAYYQVTVRAMVDGPLVGVDVKEGQDVRKGDVLARIDPRTYQASLDAAVAKKAQDAAQLANARADLVRYQKLVANNYTSAQQADTTKAQVAQFEALVAQDQANIESAQTQLSYTTIIAPFDGRVGVRLVDPGNIVHAADTTGIFVLTQLQPISVVFTLPQQSLPAVSDALRRGDAPVMAFAEDLPDRRAPPLDHGRLSVLDNQVDTTTGTIKLKATFPNLDHRLWPGGFVTVRLQTDVLPDVVTVPPSVLQRGPRGFYLFTVNPDNTVRRRDVTIGYQDEQLAVVTSGLKPGETVVTDGASRLSDNSHVNAREQDEARVHDDASARATPSAPGVDRRTTQ
jgi:membrane fusion protein, multidrug efflux system